MIEERIIWGFVTADNSIVRSNDEIVVMTRDKQVKVPVSTLELKTRIPIRIWNPDKEKMWKRAKKDTETIAREKGANIITEPYGRFPGQCHMRGFYYLYKAPPDVYNQLAQQNTHGQNFKLKPTQRLFYFIFILHH